MAQTTDFLAETKSTFISFESEFKPRQINRKIGWNKRLFLTFQTFVYCTSGACAINLFTDVIMSLSA
jgi:hypothetical protein